MGEWGWRIHSPAVKGQHPFVGERPGQTHSLEVKGYCPCVGLGTAAVVQGQLRRLGPEGGLHWQQRADISVEVLEAVLGDWTGSCGSREQNFQRIPRLQNL